MTAGKEQSSGFDGSELQHDEKLERIAAISNNSRVTGIKCSKLKGLSLSFSWLYFLSLALSPPLVGFPTKRD